MIKLVINETEYDLTDYIDEGSIAYGDNIDETRAHGAFTIPFIKPYAIVGLMFNKPLPRLSKIVTEIDGETLRWKLAEDKVSKIRRGSNPLYRHDITIIEPTVDLEKRVLPDMTVTQPKGTLDNYIYTINSLSGQSQIEPYLNYELAPEFTQTSIEVTETQQTLTFDYGTSNDGTVIEDSTLKEVREYEIILILQAYNYHTTNSSSVELELEVYSGTALLETFTYSMPSLTTKGSSGFPDFNVYIVPGILNRTERFTYTPSGTETLSIKARTSSLSYDLVEIVELGFNILTLDTQVTPKITLDEVVDKILFIEHQAPLSIPTQEFTLGTQTRNRIKNIVSPEFTFKGYTVFEALNECALYIGEQVFLGQDDFTTVEFTNFTDDFQSGIDYLDEEYNVYLNDYVTGLEINAQNVIKEDDARFIKYEPSETGYTSIRAKEIGKIDDTVATMHTYQPIYSVYSFYVKGIAFTMYDSEDNPVAFANTVEWDISDFVVEQTKWNALVNIGSGNNRSALLNKGNTLYYIQGQKNIFNLGYNDVDLAPQWNTAISANYALLEAVLCQAQIENPTYYFANDYKPSLSLFDVLMRIGYMPYSNVRVTVYRDDASELNPSIKYFNEQASLNDMRSLGDIAKKHVNRKGNSLSTYRGITTDIGNLFRLGMKNSLGEILSSYSVSINPTIREFVLNFSRENPNINAYKGTPSAYRQYEIPINDLVYRKDKYTEFVYLSETTETTTYSIYSVDQLLANFKPIPTGERLTYAQIKLDFDGEGYTETVEATVDTLSFGNTTVISIEMQDNYSAGSKQYSGTTTAGTQIYQNDTPYTDNFGKVENIKILTYTTSTITDSDEYPDNDTAISNEQSQLEIKALKDAREIWGISQELVFRSNYTNIKIFSGMAKFNGFVAKGSTVQCVPFLLKYGYTPTEKVDFTKLIQVDWSSTITDNELYTEFDVPIGSYAGYIWLEISTSIPIFAVLTSDLDTTTGETLGHSVFMYTSYSTLIPAFNVDLDTIFTVSDTLNVSQFVFPIVDLTESLTMTSDINSYKSTDYVVDLSKTMTISDSIVVVQSTDYVITLTESLTITPNIVTNIYPTQWTFIGTSGTYDYLATYVGAGSTCALSSTIKTWLETEYPITNYQYGDVIRVTRANEDLVLCSPLYYFYQAS